MSVVVVTGAERGMGRACVDRLLGTADEIIAVDLGAPEIDGARGVACDVSDPASVNRVAEEVRSLGAFRALVHAAGISPTMADPRRIFEVDLVGTQLLLDAFEPLVEPGSSAVCFASSASYQVDLAGPMPELDEFVEAPLAEGFLDRSAELFDDSGMAYSFAKRGVRRAAARAAVTWGRKGGRVNSLSPGLIDTGMGRQEFEQQPVMQMMLDATPLGRLGEAEEIAALVAFLISDDASFISGIDILIDGGGFEGFKTAIAGG